MRIRLTAGLFLLLLISSVLAAEWEVKVLDVYRNFYEDYPQSIQKYLKSDGEGHFVEDVMKVVQKKSNKVFYVIFNSDLYQEALASIEDLIKIKGKLIKKGPTPVIRADSDIEREPTE
jgi:hypothetical protein